MVKPSSSSALSPTTQASATSSAPPRRQSESQLKFNIERNLQALPLPSSVISSSVTISSHQPSKYPSIPRFAHTAPGMKSGNYTPPNGYRHGTSSASSSPPGTPPSGLRSHYLNAAFQRSHGPIYSIGSAPGSSTTLQRPQISIIVPSQPSRVHGSEPAPAALRSYSADHLQVNEPEITVTTPGGTNSTENHVMTLQRALSNLIESESREEEGKRKGDKDENNENQDDGLTMPSESKLSSSSSSPPGTPPRKRKGVTKYPKIVVDRLDPATVATSLTHDRSGSDVTLAPPHNEIMEEREEQQGKAQKNVKHRLTKLFLRDTFAVADDKHYTTATTASADMARQPSKAGVLSNLLKLQRSTRTQKQHQTPRSNARKEKKPKRPTMYSRSAGNSMASLTTKSVFGTYPPLPVTTSASPSPIATLSNFQPNPRTMNRHSLHFDSTLVQTISALNTPLQSPNTSPRGSFSGGELTPGGSGGPTYFGGNIGGMSGNGNGSGSSGMPLSKEETLRITFAVADILERQDYILRLAKSMIKYGAPSHRLEDAIDHSARTLEINLQCIYLPNVMIVAFTDYETHTSETHLLKMSAGLDMYKCALVHQVHKMVTHSAIPVEEAIMKLDAINTEKDANPRWLTVLAYAVASFCTAPMFFKGSWVDSGVAFLIGGAVGLLVWLAERVPSYAHICEITMSVVVAFVAEALHRDHVCRSAVKMAGIVIILPGYTITCAILELSSRHIISGSVRLFYAIVFSLLLGYGLTIGASIWTLFDHSAQDETFTAECPSQPLDPKWNFLFVPLFAISLNIWLKAHPRQWFLATVLSIVGYAVSYTSSTYGTAKNEVSSALAAFAIGLLGNVYQRLTRQLSFQAVVCAVFFLVPGSIGLKGALALFTADMPGGVSFALQMVVTAIAVSVGLFASALVVYPMGKTRSAQMTF
ncbi:hypothetical protein KVV02_004363 [Mortierella alpina]|uniref:Pheromone-regulated membrane protein 10 n=1 Tax=Mortierella alpina TaxID=64518 RepID=A0A9P7ZZY0_MORAP|nr:hypothetical protein KVV02_004363 [Mortierella alpina]